MYILFYFIWIFHVIAVWTFRASPWYEQSCSKCFSALFETRWLLQSTQDLLAISWSNFFLLSLSVYHTIYFRPDVFVQLPSLINPALISCLNQSKKTWNCWVVLRSIYFYLFQNWSQGRGGFSGADAPFPQGFDHLPTESFPPLYYFEISFLVTDLFFGDGYTYFKGKRAPKKRDSLVEFFQKVHKNAFLACFLKKLSAAQKFGQIRVFIVIWES